MDLAILGYRIRRSEIAVVRCQDALRSTSGNTSFTRTVPEPGQAVSADMLISVRYHESCIGGFGESQDRVSAV